VKRPLLVTARHFRVAKLIGRKDFRAAVALLEEHLATQPSDEYAMQLLLLCHRFSHDDDKAIEVASRLLQGNPNDFAGLSALSEIHASRNEPDLAAGFARRALENYPKPTKPISPSVVRLTKWFARILPSLRHMKAQDFVVLQDPNATDRKWFAWAKEYLAWYDNAVGGGSAPTLH
jgi:tetratricopeptide (TPR) repeat protein